MICRQQGFTLNTCLEQDEEPTAAEKQRVEEILAYHASVFEGIGLLNDDVAKFHVDPDITPVAAPYHPFPLAYREKLSKHLQELRDNNKIKDVDPAEHCPWISNVVISEKKDKQQIRMNMDTREPNKASNEQKSM